jgi:hypothetical protein
MCETATGAALRHGMPTFIENTALFFFSGVRFFNRPAFNNSYNFTKSCPAASDWISDAKRYAASESCFRRRRPPTT